MSKALGGRFVNFVVLASLVLAPLSNIAQAQFFAPGRGAQVRMEIRQVPVASAEGGWVDIGNGYQQSPSGKIRPIPPPASPAEIAARKAAFEAQAAAQAKEAAAKVAAEAARKAKEAAEAARRAGLTPAEKAAEAAAQKAKDLARMEAQFQVDQAARAAAARAAEARAAAAAEKAAAEAAAKAAALRNWLAKLLKLGGSALTVYQLGALVSGEGAQTGIPMPDANSPCTVDSFLIARYGSEAMGKLTEKEQQDRRSEYATGVKSVIQRAPTGSSYESRRKTGGSTVSRPICFLNVPADQVCPKPQSFTGCRAESNQIPNSTGAVPPAGVTAGPLAVFPFSPTTLEVLTCTPTCQSSSTTSPPKDSSNMYSPTVPGGSTRSATPSLVQLQAERAVAVAEWNRLYLASQDTATYSSEERELMHYELATAQARIDGIEQRIVSAGALATTEGGSTGNGGALARGITGNPHEPFGGPDGPPPERTAGGVMQGFLASLGKLVGLGTNQSTTTTPSTRSTTLTGTSNQNLFRMLTPEEQAARDEQQDRRRLQDRIAELRGKGVLSEEDTTELARLQ